RPEKSDTSFLWSEFDNNVKLLNDNIGNFIHRTLTFIYRQFNSTIPKRVELDELDHEFISKINNISYHIGKLIENFKLRKALREIVAFAKEGNIYLNEKAPWHLIKKSKEAAGQVFNICAQTVYALAILLRPFIPDTSKQILDFLNIKENIESVAWNSIKDNSIKEGHKIKVPKPLFQKLDIQELIEKLKNLKEKQKEDKNLVSYDEFQKLDIRVALIEKVEKVPKADKLYKLSIDLGTEKRTLVAGLAEHYKEQELKGKKIIVLTNLEPRKLRGIVSEGMLLAAVERNKVSILMPDKDLPPGAKIE
ncbi:MAG: methionine--tRNA ligase subunit beta, partial [Candidatus Odinarchaeota archaeon]